MIRNFLNKFHRHNYEIFNRSEFIMYDFMGYPLCLYEFTCKCGKKEWRWVDISIETLEELINHNKCIIVYPLYNKSEFSQELLFKDEDDNVYTYDSNGLLKRKEKI